MKEKNLGIDNLFNYFKINCNVKNLNSYDTAHLSKSVRIADCVQRDRYTYSEYSVKSTVSTLEGLPVLYGSKTKQKYVGTQRKSKYFSS